VALVIDHLTLVSTRRSTNPHAQCTRGALCFSLTLLPLAASCLLSFALYLSFTHAGSMSRPPFSPPVFALPMPRVQEDDVKFKQKQREEQAKLKAAKSVAQQKGPMGACRHAPVFLRH